MGISGCSSLTSITIPDSVQAISNSVFYKWKSNQTIRVPRKLVDSIVNMIDARIIPY